MNTDQSKIRKIKDFIKKYFPFIPPIYRFIMHSIPDSWYLKGLYRIKMGKKLNLKNPKTFNEKLQWLKIHDRKPIYTTMVDKYEVKKYVARIIGEQYIIPTIGVWDSFDEIDFDSLPEKFVLKCTHDSGSVILCPDKSQFDVDAARKRLSLCLKNNYYWSGREWPYKNVKPRIIAEPYLVDESFTELKDYKIFNFDGEPKLIEVDWDRFVGHKRNLYSTDWDFINAQIQWPNDPNHVFDRPKALSEMLELAKKLSQGCPHVRSDFYCIDDKVLFGELTFYHECGISTFIPQEYENTLGDWIKLPSGGGIFRNSNFYIYIRFEKTESATATTRTSSLLSATPTSSNDDALVLSKQSSTSNPELLDFKLMCFNGKVRCSFVCTDRHSDSGLKVTFFDENWNKMPFSRHYPVSDKNIAMPSQYHRMVEIAEKFSADNPFIRVDFYEIQGQLYFGELTFYPGCGFEEFTPEEWDTTLGSWIKLPSRGGLCF